MRKSILMALISLICAVPVFAVDGTETKISNNEVFDSTYPVIWENIAILQRPNGGSFEGRPTFDIFMYDMNTATLTQLASDGLKPPFNSFKIASIYSSSLAYTSTSGIKLKDINTLEERLLTTTTDGVCPSIYGGLVAYYKNGNIYLLNISDGTEIQVTASGGVYTGIQSQVVDMYGDYIVWAQNNFYHAYQISTAQEREFYQPNPYSPSAQLDIWENYLITDDSYSYLYNLNDGSYKQITTGWTPSVNKGKIVWGKSVGTNKIGIYDIKHMYSGTVTKASATSTLASPVTDGDKIIYAGDDGYYRLFDITPPSEEIYSINATGKSVTVINPYKLDDASTPEDDRIVGTIVTGSAPSDATLSPDGMSLYILNSTDKTVIAGQTYDFVAAGTWNISPTGKQTPVSVAGDDDSNVYVAMKVTRANGVVKKITASGASSELTVGINPSSIKISPDGNTLFVSNADSGNVTPIDISMDQTTGQRKFTLLPNIATGAGPKLVKP